MGDEAMALMGVMHCLECYATADRSMGEGIRIRIRMQHGALCGGGAEQD
jgi:hypothetical protein